MTRLRAYRAVATALALYSDHALRDLVDAATPSGAGIGGKSAVLEVAGNPVFVERVPLTDLERRPEHLRSTANVFELPPFCHSGFDLAPAETAFFDDHSTYEHAYTVGYLVNAFSPTASCWRPYSPGTT